MNYQGGERKTFGGTYPYQRADLDFENTGLDMRTDAIYSHQPWDIIASDLYLFYVGRFSGIAIYFFPAVAAIALFLASRERQLFQWLVLGVATFGGVLLVVWSPTNYFGGGGTLGNRYFMTLFPLYFFLVGRMSRPLVPLGLSWAMASVFLSAILIAPFQAGRRPGEHATTAAFKWLPVELSMINHLPTNSDPRKFRRRFDDGYLGYFLDNNTWFQERRSPGGLGFHVRGGSETELVVRTRHELEGLVVRVTNVAGKTESRPRVRPFGLREPRDPRGREGDLRAARGAADALRGLRPPYVLLPGDGRERGGSRAQAVEPRPVGRPVPRRLRPHRARPLSRPMISEHEDTPPSRRLWLTAWSRRRPPSARLSPPSARSISSRPAGPSPGGASGSLRGDDFESLVPGLEDGIELTTEDYVTIGSSRMTPEIQLGLAKRIRELFAERPTLAGVVVTHGTDSLEETAFLLDLLVDDERPVVFAAAQRPPRRIDTDGPRNLENAVRIAADPRARGLGVLVTLNDEVHGARDVRKTHSVALDAFASPWVGPLGHVDEGRCTCSTGPRAGSTWTCRASSRGSRSCGSSLGATAPRSAPRSKRARAASSSRSSGAGTCRRRCEARSRARSSRAPSSSMPPGRAAVGSR